MTHLLLLADDAAAAVDSSGFNHLLKLLGATLLFTLIGMLAFAVSFWLIVKLAPFSVRKEIEEDQNSALAIIVGSIIIGIALIISAAVHG